MDKRKLNPKYHFLRRCPSFSICHYEFIDSVLKNIEIDRNRTGIVIGSAYSGNQFLFEQFGELNTRGLKKVSPKFVPYTIHNSVASHLAIQFSFQGISSGVNCSQTSGLEAICDSLQYLEQGVAEHVFSGAGEEILTAKGKSVDAVCLFLSNQKFSGSKNYFVRYVSRGYGWVDESLLIEKFCDDFNIENEEDVVIFSGLENSGQKVIFLESSSSLPILEYIENKLSNNQNFRLIAVSNEKHLSYLEMSLNE